MNAEQVVTPTPQVEVAVEVSRCREVKYKCTKCGETDVVKYFADEVNLPTIICWSCRAGSGMAMHEAAVRQIGMFPVPEAA